MGEASLIYSTAEKREAQRRRQIPPLTPVLKSTSDQALILGSGCSSQGYTGCDHLLTASWWCPDNPLASQGTWCISLHAPNINIKELVEAKCPHPILQTLWSSLVCFFVWALQGHITWKSLLYRLQLPLTNSRPMQGGQLVIRDGGT